MGFRPAIVRRISAALVIAIVASGLWLATPHDAFAYSHSSAAAYADAHWNSCGVSHQYLCINNDCAAFVSESLKSGGGYPFRTPGGGIPKGSTSDDYQWYMLYQSLTGSYIWSRSFTFAQDFRDFLRLDYPGGWDRGTMPGTSLAADSGAGTGDVLFYDWVPSDNNGYDHVSIVVGYGTSDDGHYGDFVDAHSNNRHHAFWTLRSWNAHISTTVINAVYIDSLN
jgi:hypothetical protein